MQNISLMQRQQTKAYLVEECPYLRLRQRFFLLKLNVLVKVLLLAVFEHDVELVALLESLVASDDVGVLEHVEQGHLIVRLSLLLLRHMLHVHLLYNVCLIVFFGGDAEHDAETAAAELLFYRVVLDRVGLLSA